MTVKPREKPVDSDDDPVESMLKKTGCLELHYKVQVPTYLFFTNLPTAITQASMLI